MSHNSLMCGLLRYTDTATCQHMLLCNFRDFWSTSGSFGVTYRGICALGLNGKQCMYDMILENALASLQ